VAAYLSPLTGSLFPLVPWSAFILAGAALGQIYARWGASHIPAFANWALLLPGAVAFLAGLWLTSYQVELFGSGAYAFVPGNIVVRAGVCLLIVGAIAHASRAVTELPHIFGAVAQESLLIYGCTSSSSSVRSGRRGSSASTDRPARRRNCCRLSCCSSRR
jgi:hypothetical protein